MYVFAHGLLAVADPVLNVGASAIDQRPVLSHLRHSCSSLFGFVVNLMQQRYSRVINGQIDLLDMVQLIALCGLIQAIRVWKTRKEAQHKGLENIDDLSQSPCNDYEGAEALSRENSKGIKTGKYGISRVTTMRIDPITLDWFHSLDAEIADPGLLKKYSSLKSYTTSTATYPSIRTFYRPHPQADKLPSKPTPLPLLVFIHGLGGSLAQFHPLLTSLVNVAPCLGIDLPGCGLSKFSPTSWNHYTTSSLMELLCVIVEEHFCQQDNQGIVLIGHSMGCSLAALLASKILNSQVKSSVDVLSLIAICPKASLVDDRQISNLKKLLLIPSPIFNIWRIWDRRGGPESSSVARMVGRDADLETKKLQERFNAQSRTAVWRRMAWGALPTKDYHGQPQGGLPGLEVWASLNLPLFLVAGEADGITKVSEVIDIGRAMGRIDEPLVKPSNEADEMLQDLPCLHEDNAVDDSPNRPDNVLQASKTSRSETTIIGEITKPGAQNIGYSRYSKRRRVLKTSILPAPASHALLYDPATYRTLAGLIQNFLYDHVDSRLSLGWQLQHLSTEGKWDVKNLVKWQAIRPVSEPIAGIFRAMKTLREIDQSHSPEIFVRDWKGRIKAVIDISHESPVYDPKGLEEGGIEYHKFPTVSKIPPTAGEVRDFVKLVDRLRMAPCSVEAAMIGVHCHYGFNRTGFFICCYLIEKENFGVQQAIDEFRAHRAPGIRHEHFLDTLFVRYCVGLKRAPTM